MEAPKWSDNPLPRLFNKGSQKLLRIALKLDDDAPDAAISLKLLPLSGIASFMSVHSKSWLQDADVIVQQVFGPASYYVVKQLLAIDSE